MKLLVAEDERDLSRALEMILRHNNYTVDVVYNGRDALDYARSDSYDGLLLDVMMPGLDGFAVLDQLRAEGIRVPVLFLTAKGESEDKVRGLDLGADDYVTKPFDMAELLARIRAMTRRGTEYSPVILSFGDLSLNTATYELVGPDGKVRLAGKEYQVMEEFLSFPERVISTGRFMERVWGFNCDSEINVVWVCISSLRKKIAAVGSSVTLHATRGLGYSMEMECHDP